MLIRDLPLKPRNGSNEYWDSIVFHIYDGIRIRVQRATDKHYAYRHGSWWIYRFKDRGEINKHLDMDEFEAQAVFDHYAQLYDLENNPALKLSRDT